MRRWWTCDAAQNSALARGRPDAAQSTTQAGYVFGASVTSLRPTGSFLAVKPWCIAKQSAQLLYAGYGLGRRAHCRVQSLVEARRPRFKAAYSGLNASGMLQTLRGAPRLGSCSSGRDHR